MPPNLQPFVHDLVTTIAAPSITLSAVDGQIDGRGGAQGFYLGDRRMLSLFRVLGFECEPSVVHTRHHPGGSFDIVAVLRDGSEPTPDPTLLLSRSRSQHRAGFTEQWTFRNHGSGARVVSVQLSTATDFADTTDVKCGRPPTQLQPAANEPGGLIYRHDRCSVSVRASGDPVVDIETGQFSWETPVEPHGQATITIEVDARADDAAFRAAIDRPWRSPTVHSSDRRLDDLVAWGFNDLADLALADIGGFGDTFISAGSPWYLTLFGRDSLWAARMLLPFGIEPAASTLRVLARRQGTRVNPMSAEQPGRILHEARPDVVDMGEIVLPPLYYGSIDATPLWISTLAEAWRWGMSQDDVTALLPPLRAAADWLLVHSDADGDGLLEYIDGTGHGLSNQGWKDSGDAVNWIDGRLAEAPIALAEVQGYAYRAALDAAELLEVFGDGSDDCHALRGFATRLHAAFHERYWLHDDLGAYIAVALDGDKRPVDSVTTNPGHLLATGLLDPNQEAIVVQRLMSQLACPAGLRTLSGASDRFSPISYHNGSIWPHDMAICARGMILSGFHGQAADVLRGLLVAVEAFGGRLPELYGYDDELGVIPYPASCRPQAWSAAAAAVAVWATTPIVPGADGPTMLIPARIAEEVEIDGFVHRGQRVRTRHRQGIAEIEVTIDDPG